MFNLLIYKKKFYRKTETFIHRQVEWLTRGFNVILAAEEFSNPTGFDFNNVAKVQLNQNEQILRRWLTRLTKNKQDRKYLFYNDRQVAHLFREKKIDVIHAHFGASAVKILKVARKYHVPLVVSFHGLDASKELSNKGYRDQLPSLFDYASKIIIVSRHMIETLQLQNWSEKVVLLPYSIDSDLFKPSHKTSLDEKIRLLHSGSIVPKKGVPDLIDVFAKINSRNKNIRLVILGEGAEYEWCKRKVAELSIGNAVEFLGAQPHHVVKMELNEADIFVLNSRTDDAGNMEGTPVSILEAMSMEKAVVSTYHAGIPDVIKDGYNGRLVAEKDNAALERTLEELIESADLRNKLGKEARRTIINKYSGACLLPVLEESLREAVKNSPHLKNKYGSQSEAI
jgi:glycosyltransferase involved in cell wall biosynthesis